MMHTTTSLPSKAPLQAVRFVGWLCALVLALCCKPAAGPLWLVTGEGAQPGRLALTEEATPDCDIPPPQPFPAKQRAEHLTRLGVDRWHAAGVRGRGMKVAVLDTGFRGYRARLGEVLPARVTTRSFRADGNLEARDSQHGILCGEVIHALAPEAELLFANWDPDRPEEFLEAARWARAEGARVISCSVIMPSWSDGEGGGPVNQALARTVGADSSREGILCFASAGNTAQRHWSGAFNDAGNGVHQWRPGQTCNTLTAWSTDPVSVELYTGCGAQYEVSVHDAMTGLVMGRALASRRDAERCTGIVEFAPRPGGAYGVQVRLLHGKGGPFHLVVLGGSLSCSRARGSIACPADNPAVLAIGAVDGHGHRAAYSSCGPNSNQPKPDFVAPVPFPSLWRSRPFTGTSAAAPQAAAVAALCWSRHPDWTAGQVRTALRSAALDLGLPGHDWETGFGLVRMPQQETQGDNRTR